MRWLLAALAVAVALPAHGQTFQQDLLPTTLRVDMHHWGNHKEEQIALDTLYVEGEWAGSRTHLTDSPDYGKYRFKVLDRASGKVLYEQGYSTLFGEWQTTTEATQVTRVFHETVRFPLPRADAILEIYSRTRNGRLRRVFRETLHTSSYQVRRVPAPVGVQTRVLHDSGDPARTLDVVIVADGYGRNQQQKARRDLARYAEVLLTTPPFDRYHDRISVRGVLAIAGANGPDEPRKGLFTAPPAGSSFNTFDSARYLTTLDNKALRDLAGQVPYDALYVMVNSSRYGGAGIYNFFSIFVSDNEYDEYVFIHEFGHGFGGLADEYYSSSVAYSDFYPRGVEPWEPNITAFLDGPESVKWHAMVSPETPIPTPEEAQYAQSVGVFEGAGYAAKGLYRPAVDCKMFSKKQIDFCPVCMAAVEAMIQRHTE